MDINLITPIQKVGDGDNSNQYDLYTAYSKLFIHPPYPCIDILDNDNNEILCIYGFILKTSSKTSNIGVVGEEEGINIDIVHNVDNIDNVDSNVDSNVDNNVDNVDNVDKDLTPLSSSIIPKRSYPWFGNPPQSVSTTEFTATETYTGDRTVSANSTLRPSSNNSVVTGMDCGEGSVVSTLYNPGCDTSSSTTTVLFKVLKDCPCKIKVASSTTPTTPAHLRKTGTPTAGTLGAPRSGYVKGTVRGGWIGVGEVVWRVGRRYVRAHEFNVSVRNVDVLHDGRSRGRGQEGGEEDQQSEGIEGRYEVGMWWVEGEGIGMGWRCHEEGVVYVKRGSFGVRKCVRGRVRERFAYNPNLRRVVWVTGDVEHGTGGGEGREREEGRC